MPDDKMSEPDGILAYVQAIKNPKRSDPNWPLPSFDARDWAEAFCKIAAEQGHPGIDEGWMITWFANALMRGYDEANMRQVERDRAATTPAL
jgi:hypothetical protein